MPFHLSIANAHCRTASSGSPHTTKNASITAASILLMFCFPAQATKASSTYIGSSTDSNLPVASKTPGLCLHLTAFTNSSLEGSLSGQRSMFKYFSCLPTKDASLKNTFVMDWMMRRKGSQLVADVFDPNTILVAKQYIEFAEKPKQPVRSAWIRAKRKHALTSATAKKISKCGKLMRILYTSSYISIFAVPNVIKASNSREVTSLRTISWGHLFVDASHTTLGFLPSFTTIPWDVCLQ